MTDLPKPKWNRRKQARPGEIVEAALDLFVDKGFAATRLTEVAQRAGVAKGTLYLYFDTKEDLFRAAVRHILAANLAMVDQAAAQMEAPVCEVLPALLRQAVRNIGASRAPAIVRMVLAESRAFPDLALIWRDEIIAPILAMLTTIIASGQTRGEIRAGDPHHHALSIVGPILTAVLHRDVFGTTDSPWPDLEAFALQHADTVLHGLSAQP